MHRILLIAVIFMATAACRVEAPRTRAEFGQGTGVRLVEDPETGTWFVNQVSSGSPADAAGVKVGDEFVSFNGIAPPPAVDSVDCAAKGLALRDWREEVSSRRAGGIESVVLKRDGVVLEMEIPVQPFASLLRPIDHEPAIDELGAISSGLMTGCKMCWSGCPEDCGGYVSCKPGNVCSTRCVCG
jgi:hypothetical protein